MGDVICIFKVRAKKDQEDDSMKPEKVESDIDFEELMRRNMKNLERMRKERQTKNKGVLRSYHIKH